MSPKLRGFVVAMGIAAPLDWISKRLIEREVGLFEVVPVLGNFFGLTHLRNPGSALGFFQDLPLAFFIAMSAFAAFLIGGFLLQAPGEDRYSGTALGLIAGGAIGNGVDRFVQGAVVDFLRFDLKLFVFPPFNLADAAIVCGVGLILLDIVAGEASESLQEAQSAGSPGGETPGVPPPSPSGGTGSAPVGDPPDLERS